MHIWQGRNNAKGISQHPLLAPVVPFFGNNFKDHIDVIGINAPVEDLADYGGQMLCWLRLTMLEDVGDGFSGADYWHDNVMWINCQRELLRTLGPDESNLDFSVGPKLLDLLALRRDGPTNSEQYKEAEEIAWTQLTETSMIKIGTIKGLVDWVSLGTLWNMPENRGKDNEPGTFAELWRYVPVHYRQTRKGITTYEPKRAAVTFRKGHLEP
jgi:hypothetical protein